MDPKQLVHSDSLLSDRVRLAIMATLASAPEPLDFTTVLESLELTKGNLATHIRKLEDAGLLRMKKQFVDRKPRTTYECTAEGRRQLSSYLERIERVLRGVLRQ